MRIKVLLNLGADLPDYKQDQVVEDADEATCLKLIRMGVATELPPVRVDTAKETEEKSKPKPPAVGDKKKTETQDKEH